MSTPRSTKAKTITFIGAAANIIQGIIKIIGGVWFNSHALIADGMHSFSDLLTDLMVIFASHYGSQAADEMHPYGHHRIETAATLLLSLLLILAGLGIGWHAFDEWKEATLDLPAYGALVIACLSILANEILFFQTIRIGKQIHSELIKANAWHRRSDSASSIVVALGITGSLLGYHYLDTLAAMVVALLIIKMGVDYSWNSVKELVDTAVSPEIVRDIEKIISSVPGVNKIHQLRTRSMGGHILVDVHILVFPFLSVSEGHYIAQHVHQALVKQLPHIKDVTVHVDPEDDEIASPSMHLSNRKTLEQSCLIPLQKAYPAIQTWNIHYLAGQIILDIYLQSVGQDLSSINEHCNQLFKQKNNIKSIRFFMLSHILQPFSQ